MQKVGLSQYFFNIVQAQLKSLISCAERSFSVKSGLTTCISQSFITIKQSVNFRNFAISFGQFGYLSYLRDQLHENYIEIFWDH